MKVKLKVSVSDITEDLVDKILKDISEREKIDIDELDDYSCIFSEMEDVIKKALEEKFPDIKIKISSIS